MVTDVIPLLRIVTRILEEVGLRYVIGGSLASGIHGELRATNDIDILIELPLGRVRTLVSAMKPEFDIGEDTVLATVTAGRSFSTLHIEMHVKVDFFPAGDSVLDRLELERRQGHRLSSEPTRDLYFATAEDIVLRKLDWFRRSGGHLERQLRDVVGVLKLQREALDRTYLESMAARIGLTELLQQCLEDAGLT